MAGNSINESKGQVIHIKVVKCPSPEPPPLLLYIEWSRFVKSVYRNFGCVTFTDSIINFVETFTVYSSFSFHFSFVFFSLFFILCFLLLLLLLHFTWKICSRVWENSYRNVLSVILIQIRSVISFSSHYISICFISIYFLQSCRQIYFDVPSALSPCLIHLPFLYPFPPHYLPLSLSVSLTLYLYHTLFDDPVISK